MEGASAPDYPMQKKRQTLRVPAHPSAHLRSRTNTFRRSSGCAPWRPYAIHRFFQERGFVYVHTPIITT